MNQFVFKTEREMKCSLGALFVICFISSVYAEKVRYDNYKILNLKLNNLDKVAFIDKLKKLPAFSFLRNIEHNQDVLLAPKELQKLAPLLKKANISSEILIDNIQEIIDDEEVKTKAAGDTFTWDRYQSYESIQKFIDGIIEDHPDVVTPFVIGKSYEGREIRGIKISYKEGNRGIFLESNIHAREWITSATCTYFINELVNSEDPDIRYIAENVDWYIIPVFNVDGFVYSHEKDRLWRKTRQPNTNPECPGADPNRNFDHTGITMKDLQEIHVMKHLEVFLLFLNPNVKLFLIIGIKDKIGVYLAYHSYGQYILSPYGHSKTEFPPNYNDIQEIAKSSYDAILAQGYGTTYRYGSTGSVLYIASGSSVDYTYNELDIKIGYTFEFRDQGRYGFVLPSINILPNCQETVAAMIALVKKAQELSYL
uniref:Peptidase M14 domain-containing protein n=1 Tax=Megaselia scalaris TaxID=36166 RepID=T1GQS9_MEGSC